MDEFKKWWRRMFPQKPIRLELRLVPYGRQADQMVREGWTIAPEEDGNTIFGHVYLERLGTPGTRPSGGQV